MSELVVVGFKQNRSRAAQLLGELREADEPWTAHLHGAIAVYRDEGGKLAIDESYESTKGNAIIGHGLFGTLVGLAVAALALPLTAAAGGVVALGAFAAAAIGGGVIGARHHLDEEASWWKNELPLPDGFIASVADLVGAGDSAIFFLLRAPDATDFAARFEPLGGTVVRTQLTRDQAEKVHARVTRTQIETTYRQ